MDDVKGGRIILPSIRPAVLILNEHLETRERCATITRITSRNAFNLGNVSRNARDCIKADDRLSVSDIKAGT